MLHLLLWLLSTRAVLIGWTNLLVDLGMWALPMLPIALVAVIGGANARKALWAARLWLLLAVMTWAAAWTGVRFAAAADGLPPSLWLARSVLRGFNASGAVVISPWFLISAIVLFLIRRELPALIERVTRGLKNLEVAGVKLSLGDVDGPGAALTAGWWSDAFSSSDADADVPASGGRLQERPATRIEAYDTCLTESREWLETVDDTNQHQCGDTIEALEDGWNGEYREWLLLTVDLLWQALHEKRLTNVVNKFLATCLSCRHIVLYLNGDRDHANFLLRTLDVADAEHTMGTLRRPIGYWFLIGLCQRSDFPLAARLLDHAVMRLPEMEGTRAAYLAYVAFRRGRYQEAIGYATGAIRANDFEEAALMREYVAARSYQRLRLPLKALEHAEKARTMHVAKASGLRRYIRLHSMRTYVRACVELKLYDRVLRLFHEDDGAQADSYVLNAMAVYVAGIGQAETAAGLLEQAVRAAGDDSELKQTIHSNQEALRKSAGN